MADARSSSPASLLLRTALGAAATLVVLFGLTLLLGASWEVAVAAIPGYLWVAVLGGVVGTVLDELRRRRRAPAPPAARP